MFKVIRKRDWALTIVSWMFGPLAAFVAVIWVIKWAMGRHEQKRLDSIVMPMLMDLKAKGLLEESK